MVVHRKSTFLVIILMSFCFSNGQCQNKKVKEKLYGYAAENYEIASLLFKDRLNNQSKFQKNWIVQMSQADQEIPRYARIENDKLQVHDPRGSTIWYKNKLKGPIMISYRVTVPTAYNQGNDIVARDVNQFWMANTPNSINAFSKGGLFDSTKYDGGFKSYEDIHSYYASTGGGNNTTTRMRRYPRGVDGELVDHMGLNYRDGILEFLLAPDIEHQIQLVAANDIVQYIFDGKIVYEIKSGDAINIINDATKNVKNAIWGEAPWLPYNEGYFGFRMTKSHHNYSNFKVYELKKRN